MLSGKDGAVIPITYNYWVTEDVITMSNRVRILVSVVFFVFLSFSVC